MATIDLQARDNLLVGVYYGLFNALPGADRLAWLVAKADAGSSLLQIADALVTEFAGEYAAGGGVGNGWVVATRLLGEHLVSADAYAWAYSWAGLRMDAAGVTPQQVIVEAVTTLLATTNPNFTRAQERLENLGGFARYLAEQGWNPASRGEALLLTDLVGPGPQGLSLAQQMFAAARTGAVLTTGADNLSAETFAALGSIDTTYFARYFNTLQSTDVLTGLGTDASLYARIMTHGDGSALRPTLHNIANAHFEFGDLSVLLDLQQASGLRELTLQGHTWLEVYGLRADGLADGRMLAVDASGLDWRLYLVIEAPAAYAASAVTPDALRDLAIVTGARATDITLLGALAGSIAGTGDATIRLTSNPRPDPGEAVSWYDLTGVAAIEGFHYLELNANDLLATRSDLGGHPGFDDVSAARVSADFGRVAVRHLRSALDWDGGTARAVGASIAFTGTQGDQVQFATMADGARISMGAGDDQVRVAQLDGATILGGDLDGDGLGAVLDLGAGADSFRIDAPAAMAPGPTIVAGRGAIVRGAETVHVEVRGNLSLTGPLGTSGAPVFLGTEALELFIPDPNATNVPAAGRIEADIAGFDGALGKVWLYSGTAAGAAAAPAFVLHNVRAGVTLQVGAADFFEGASPATDQRSDALLSIDRASGAASRNSAARDLHVWASHADVRGLNDSATVSILTPHDLELTLAPTSSDAVGAAASPNDDDAMLVEHLTLAMVANSRVGPASYDLNGFGDVAHRALRPAAQQGDTSATVATSLTLVGTYRTYTVDEVNADVIVLKNGSWVLRVDAENNYRITADTWQQADDLIDLRADTLRADDSDTAVDRADHIDLGGGFDTLIVGGDNHLGSNDLTPTRAATTFNDDVFAHITGVEEILVDTDTGSAGATQMFTLDEAAANRGLERIRFVGSDHHTLQAAIGAHYDYNGRSYAPGTLHFDASGHQGDFDVLLSIAQPPLLPRSYFGLHVRAGGSAAVNGDNVTLVDTGTDDEYIELLVTTAGENVDTRLFEGTAAASGDVGFSVRRGSIDGIRLVDGGAENAAGVETTADRYVIAAAWTAHNGEFLFDGTAIADTDANPATGGLYVSAKLSDARQNFIHGSQNQDFIEGSAGFDLMQGGAGDDTLIGGAAVDQLTGGSGADVFVLGSTGAAGLVTVPAAADSNRLYADVLDDFTSGTDSLSVHLDSRGHSVNLARFTHVAPGTAVAPLDGASNARGPVVGAALYSPVHGGFAVDTDGNGYINSMDVAVRSSRSIGAADVGYVVAGTAANNLMRAGLGADTLRGFGGNDTFVVVGASADSTRAALQLGGNAAHTGIAGDVAAVLGFDELVAQRQASEAPGDVYDGGAGVDYLHVFGDVNLAATQLSGIEWVVQRGTATYTLAQLGLRNDGGSFSATGGGIERIALHGPLAHRIVIVEDDGAQLGLPQQVAALRAFAERAGQQLYLPGGDANTRLAIGGNNLGIDALLGPLSALRDELGTSAALTSTEPFTSGNGLYAIAQLAPAPATGVFDVAADYQLLDLGAGALSVQFSGEFQRSSREGNFISMFDSGSGGDVLDFRAIGWLSGGIEPALEGAASPFDGTIAAYGGMQRDVPLNGKLALVSEPGALIGATTADTIAGLLDGSGPFGFTQEGENRALLMTGSVTGVRPFAATPVKLWFIDDANDDGVVTAAEVHLVGQINMLPGADGIMLAGDSIHNFHAANFLFA